MEEKAKIETQLPWALGHKHVSVARSGPPFLTLLEIDPSEDEGDVQS